VGGMAVQGGPGGGGHKRGWGGGLGGVSFFSFFTKVCGLFSLRGLFVLQRQFSFEISSEFWWGDQRLCQQAFGGSSSRVEQ